MFSSQILHHQVLLEVRNFFPLNLGDSELLFSRLLSAYPTLARETHRLYVIEILSRVLDEAWFPPTFPVAVCLNQISSIVEQEG